MNIDRARFLVWTSLVSAALTSLAACTIQKKDDPNAHPEDAPIEPPVESNDQTQPAETTKSAVLDASPGSTSDAKAASDADAGATPDAAKDSGPACLGDDGVKAECAGSKCEWDCSEQEPRWKRAVMSDVASCLEMSLTCEGASKRCVEAALPKACPDATATAYCKGIVDSCAGNEGWEITQNECEGMAKALTEAGRTELLSCVNEGIDGYCRWDSAWCLEAMKW